MSNTRADMLRQLQGLLTTTQSRLAQAEGRCRTHEKLTGQLPPDWMRDEVKRLEAGCIGIQSDIDQLIALQSEDYARVSGQPIDAGQD